MGGWAELPILRDGGQRLCESRHGGIVTDTDADAAVQGCDAGHPDEDALRGQFFDQTSGFCAIAAAIHGDEVGGGRQGDEPLCAGDTGQRVAGGGNAGLHIAQPCLILQGGKGTRLGHATDAEMISDTVKGGDKR